MIILSYTHDKVICRRRKHPLEFNQISLTDGSNLSKSMIFFQKIFSWIVRTWTFGSGLFTTSVGSYDLQTV